MGKICETAAQDLVSMDAVKIKRRIPAPWTRPSPSPGQPTGTPAARRPSAGDGQLSTTAAGLVLQSLESHWKEWREHITRGRCAALVCAPFCHVYIAPGLCTG